jgi:Na+/H+ antiporter NhaC
MHNKLKKLNRWDNILNLVFILLLIVVILLYIKGLEVNSSYIILVFGLINMARSLINKSYSDFCREIMNNEN